MKKHMIIAALFLGNAAWTMNTNKESQSTPEKNGWDVIDDVNKNSGIIHNPNQPRVKIIHKPVVKSKLFTIIPSQQSKL